MSRDDRCSWLPQHHPHESVKKARVNEGNKLKQFGEEILTYLIYPDTDY